MLVGPKKNPVEILTPEVIVKLPQEERRNVGCSSEKEKVVDIPTGVYYFLH